MQYAVRTVAWSPERAVNVERMQAQIPNLAVIVDDVGDGYACFFEACRLLNETGGVLLEDDVLLCRDFTARCEAIIAEKGPDQLISFFERPKIELPTALVAGSSFMWMQCIYMPPGFPALCSAYYDEFRTTRPKRWTGMATDSLIAFVLVKEKMRYWRIRPTLVQHLPFPSVIGGGGRPTNRQTLFFIDDLEETA